MKKLWIVAIGILLLLSGCEKKEEAQKKVIKPVKILQVKGTKNLLIAKTPGTVRAAKRAELSFDIPGRIVVLNAKEGAEIKKGDVIAELDKSDYQNNYLSAQANLKESKLTLGRYQKLFDQKAIARANLDKAQKDFDIAKANMQVVKKALNDTKLRAFFSGTISARYVENFKNIQAKEPIVSIEDKSILEIVINIPEKIISKYNEKDILSIKASFDIIKGKKFPLVVKEISTKADKATRTYAIVLAMRAPKKYNILSGMTADVEVTLDKKTNLNKILIPSTAILGDKNDKSFVWIYSDKTKNVSKKEVIIGNMSGNEVEIKSGLNIQETIVVAGVNYLVEGMMVRPLSDKMGE